MPSANFVEASKDVTLMIHEATMADDEKSLASAKKHSTISDALDTGRRSVFTPSLIAASFSKLRIERMPNTFF